MDFILFILYLIFGAITVSPFVWMYYKEQSGDETVAINEEQVAVREKRRMVMDNLKDLKMEFDTGKLTAAEFSELSEGIVLELKHLDEKMPVAVVSETKKEKKKCQCGYVITLTDARFCPSCGAKL